MVYFFLRKNTCHRSKTSSGCSLHAKMSRPAWCIHTTGFQSHSVGEETCLLPRPIGHQTLCFQTKDDFHMLLLRIDWLGEAGIRWTAVFMQRRQQITRKSDKKIWGLKKGVRLYNKKLNTYYIYIYTRLLTNIRFKGTASHPNQLRQ